METDLRTDSADYRTELLSPAATPPGQHVPQTPAWQLNMDGIQLPEKHTYSGSGFGHFLQTLSNLFSLSHSFISCAQLNYDKLSL
jgi:hypothetical protein